MVVLLALFTGPQTIAPKDSHTVDGQNTFRTNVQKPWNDEPTLWFQFLDFSHFVVRTDFIHNIRLSKNGQSN